MRLEPNKRYRCLNGDIVIISEAKAHVAYGRMERDGNSVSYSPDGRAMVRHFNHWDIVGLAEPELMFSFSEPAPQHSRIVSESALRGHIGDVLFGHSRSHDAERILALAAERMIEMAKAPKPKPEKLRLKPAESIRAQLAQLLEDVGLNPDRFLVPRHNNPHDGPSAVHYTKDPSRVMCPSEPTTKQVAEQAARELANMLNVDLGIDVTPILLRLWLNERWEQVAKLAHKIHNGAKD